MPTADNDGTIIEYETIGDPEDEAVLLIMGLTAQLTAWDLDFCRLLADRGRFVIRFDNRDCGLSSKTDGAAPNIMSLMMAVGSGEAITDDVPYTLSDMAADAMSVLDALGIDKAHVVGASMGGMIAQQTAIEFPERVLSLTSIMSTTGNSKVGQGSPEAMGALFSPPPDGREAALERSVKMAKIVSGRHFDAAEMKARAGAAFDRCYHPIGVAFQLAAIVKTGDRTEALGALAVPTVVIHGEADALVGLSGGEATAAAVPGAKLITFDDMGHDLPAPRWPEIVDAIVGLGH